MKPSVFTALLAVFATTMIPVQAAGGVRVGCEYGPTLTPAPTTESPAPTTVTPAPEANGPPVIEVFDASDKLLFSRSVVPVGKCIAWTNCFSERLETVAWQTLGPVGTSITFFDNTNCISRRTVVSFRASAPQTVHNADAEDFQLADFQSFVVLDTQHSAVDATNAIGCVAPA